MPTFGVSAERPAEGPKVGIQVFRVFMGGVCEGCLWEEGGGGVNDMKTSCREQVVTRIEEKSRMRVSIL